MSDNNSHIDLESSCSFSVDTNESFNQDQLNDDSKIEILKRLDDSEEPFYFESDTLALRNNPDYSCLLKTLVLLEAQRVTAYNDIETLIDLKEQALEDPHKFVEALNKKRADGDKDNLLDKIPPRQKVYVVPEIDWEKYYECVDLSEYEAIKTHNTQRVHSLRQSVKLIQQQESKVAEEKPTRSSARSSTQAAAASAKAEKEKEVKNYNKSWSVGEQRQLEELLIEFPPEDNEAQRFRKIANKLGTRTPLQVQSHCQKYFIKLAKAGLPIPGRMPNLKTYVTKKGNRGNRRSGLMRGACHATSGLGGGRGRLDSSGGNSMGRKMVGRGTSLNEISSMWTSFNPPITMNDENDQNEAELEEHSSSYNFNENSEDQFREYEEGDEQEYSQDN